MPAGGRCCKRCLQGECQARLRAARAAAGLCRLCGRPPAAGTKLCGHCRDVKGRSDRRVYAAKSMTDLCVRCGRPTSGAAVKCEPCLRKLRAEYKRRKKADTLSGGGGPWGGSDG
jgi:hypothetical protein